VESIGIRPRHGLSDEGIATMPNIPVDQYNYLLELLSRVGVDSNFLRPMASAASLPPGAAEYLVPSNPRLMRLRQQYGDYTATKFSHSQWDSARLDHKLPLQSFRGDCPYVWQRWDLNSPAALLLTYYYELNHPRMARILRGLKEDELFGCVTLTDNNVILSRDLLDSVIEIDAIATKFNLAVSHMAILDIGSGYGRLAHRLAAAFPGRIRVLCTDAIPESTFIAEYYLGFRAVLDDVRVVPVDMIQDALTSSRPDLALSVHCFSECTSDAIKWWLCLLRDCDVRNLLIIPNPDRHQGTALLSTEGDRQRHDMLPVLEAFGYHRVDIRPKYSNSNLQRFGVSPTNFHWFELTR